jgi:hypothetical protein
VLTRPSTARCCAAEDCLLTGSSRRAVLGGRSAALPDLGGWHQTLAGVAEVLVDPTLSGVAKADFREVVRLLARRWGRAPESQALQS